MESFKKITDTISISLAYIAGFSIFACMMLVVYNAIIRNFGDPIGGTSEIAGLLGMFGITLALGYTQKEKGNVGINIITDKLSGLYKEICNFIVLLISLAFFAFVSIKLFDYGMSLIENEAFLQTTGFTIYPFVFVMTFGFVGLVIQLFYQLVESALHIKNGGEVK